MMMVFAAVFLENLADINKLTLSESLCFRKDLRAYDGGCHPILYCS